MTPILIGAASLAGRRWGPGVSGWFVGLPLTSGPIAFFLALEQGVGFAAAAAVGSLAGAVAQAVFCLVYGRFAPRSRWPLAFVWGSVGFGVASVVLQPATLTLTWFFPVVVVTLVLAIRFMPRGADAIASLPPPRWDIPARMVVTTALVLLLTAVAPALGPRLSGLLATFPVYAAILTVFAHQLQGSPPAIQVLRGLLFGLFTFAAFFFVLGVLIERVGVATAFAAAIAVALALHAMSLGLVRGSTGRGALQRLLLSSGPSTRAR